MPSTSPTLPYYPKGRRAHLNAKLEEWKANRKSTRNNMLEASGKRGQRRRDMAAIEAKYASMRPSVHFTSENAARAIATEKRRYKNRRARRQDWFKPSGKGRVCCLMMRTGSCCRSGPGLCLTVKRWRWKVGRNHEFICYLVVQVHFRVLLNRVLLCLVHHICF